MLTPGRTLRLGLTPVGFSYVAFLFAVVADFVLEPTYCSQVPRLGTAMAHYALCFFARYVRLCCNPLYWLRLGFPGLERRPHLLAFSGSFCTFCQLKGLFVR